MSARDHLALRLGASATLLRRYGWPCARRFLVRYGGVRVHVGKTQDSPRQVFSFYRFEFGVVSLVTADHAAVVCFVAGEVNSVRICMPGGVNLIGVERYVHSVR